MRRAPMAAYGSLHAVRASLNAQPFSRPRMTLAEEMSPAARSILQGSLART